jgi:hypothetical protein
LVSGIDQIHRPAGNRSVPVTRGDQEIDLQRPIDLSYEIAEKDETSFEQTEHQKVAIGISACDLHAQLSHSLGEGTFVKRDTLYCPSRKARIGLGAERLDGAGHASASGRAERL